MNNKTITWVGIFKAVLFVLAFLLRYGFLLALYTLLFIHFDEVEGFSHGVQSFCNLFIAGMEHSWPEMLKMTLIIFALLASWKIILDTINSFRERKSKSP